MLFLTASAAPQPDYVALGMVLVMAVIVAAMTLRKYLSKQNGPKPGAVPAPVAAAPEAPKPTAPGSAGQLKLHDVEPKTAAMIMAIVAHQTGKPLNELRFLSIKEVK